MNQFNWAEEAAKQWDERSNSWSSKSEVMWETGSRKDIIPFFTKFIQAGEKVCDLGCGDGHAAFKLAKKGYAVTGIDVSEEMIHKAKQLSIETTAQFKKGDISELPFTNDEFDAILAINSLEWTEQPLIVLKEIKRVVKHDGHACVGILGPTAGPRVNSFRRLYNEKVICNTMMPWEFEKLATENNWSVIDSFGVYKQEAVQLPLGSLSTELKQALSFMWVFMLKNNKQEGMKE